MRLLLDHLIIRSATPADTLAGRGDRLAASLAAAALRLPGVARAATRRAGSSMVVLTEYDFDVEAIRARRVEASGDRRRGAADPR